MNNYKQFDVSFEPFDVETITGLLWQEEIEGVVENDFFISIFVKQESSFSEKALTNLFTKFLNDDLITKFDFKTEVVENKNWNEEWEKKIEVMEIGKRIVIKPTFRTYEPTPEKLVVELDPKMSFGTGEHNTTKLMIEFVEKYVCKNDFVLDAGSGTGILAILAVKLGASKAIAFDNDEWCLINGKENIDLNHVQEKVDFRLCEISQIEESEFDLVLANINTHILQKIKSALFGKTKIGGKLIISGLLDKDEHDLKNSFIDLGFQYAERKQSGEWVSMVFEKT